MGAERLTRSGIREPGLLSQDLWIDPTSKNISILSFLTITMTKCKVVHYFYHVILNTVSACTRLLYKNTSKQEFLPFLSVCNDKIMFYMDHAQDLQ